MKSIPTLGFLALGLVATTVSGLAHPHPHAVFHEKKDTPDTGGSCGGSYGKSNVVGGGSPLIEQSSSAAAPTVAPTVAPSSPSSPSSSSLSPSPSAGSSGSISPNGNQWAFCYTPYTGDGNCKSADQVSSDIASLKAKGFTSVRVYGTDCSTLQNVGSAAKASGLKMLVGVYIDGAGIGSKSDDQVNTIIQWGASNWGLVEMVVVGNEAIFNGFASASQLAGYITTVKGKLQAAGYNGPVTTTEPLGTIQQYGSTICPVVDVIGANIHPFFNTAVSSLLAGSFVAGQLKELSKVCNDQKEAYCLETGWPSAGSANGLAVPGFDAQRSAIQGIASSAGSRSAFFSFLDDKWKAPGDHGVEQSWGCASLFG